MEAKDLREKSVEELKEELLGLRKEQFKLRRQNATGELNQNHQHRLGRKEIARVKTVLNELGRAAGESK